MTQLRFIHMADLHLGNRQYGLSERLKDFGNSALRAAELGVEQKPDFVLIVGDVFNDSRPYPIAIRQAVKVLRVFHDKKIPVYVIRGNHDASYARSERLGGDSLHLLEDLGLVRYIHDEVAEFEQDGQSQALICGVGYYGRNTGEKLEQVFKEQGKTLSKKGPMKILMAHCFVEGMAPLYDVPAYVLGQAGFDYVALGHYHKTFRDDRAKLYDPGATEHCTTAEWDEPDRGINLVTAEQKPEAKTWKVTVQRLPIQVRPKKSFVVELGSIEAHDVEARAAEIIREHDQQDAILRAELRGCLRGDTFAFINTNAIGAAATKALYVTVVNNLETSTLPISQDASYDEIVEEVLVKELGISKSEVKRWSTFVTDMKEILAGNEADMYSSALTRLEPFTRPRAQGKRASRPMRALKEAQG